MPCVSELTDDQFSATFGSGRGVGAKAETDILMDVTAQEIDIELGSKEKYVVVFRDGRFLAYDRETRRSYPVAFEDCTYFTTIAYAQRMLRLCEKHSIDSVTLSLIENDIESAVVKKMIALKAYFEDIEGS